MDFRSLCRAKGWGLASPTYLRVPRSPARGGGNSWGGGWADSHGVHDSSGWSFFLPKSDPWVRGVRERGHPGDPQLVDTAGALFWLERVSQGSPLPRDSPGATAGVSVRGCECICVNVCEHVCGRAR